MTMPPIDRAEFTPWQARVCDRVATALDAGRLGHGLLFCGPALLGKHAVAAYLARRVLCMAREPGGEPCGQCRSCQLIAAGSHPDFRDSRCWRLCRRIAPRVDSVE